MKQKTNTRKNKNLLASMNESQLLKELKNIKENDEFKKNKEMLINTYLRNIKKK